MQRLDARIELVRNEIVIPGRAVASTCMGIPSMSTLPMGLRSAARCLRRTRADSARLRRLGLTGRAGRAAACLMKARTQRRAWYYWCGYRPALLAGAMVLVNTVGLLAGAAAGHTVADRVGCDMIARP
jgi:hypothetical protein